MKKASEEQIEYEISGEKAFAILRRSTVKKPTDHCPFCGKRHMHGEGEGHRVAHCLDDVSRPEIAVDDVILRQSDGYMVYTDSLQYSHPLDGLVLNALKINGQDAVSLIEHLAGRLEPRISKPLFNAYKRVAEDVLDSLKQRGLIERDDMGWYSKTNKNKSEIEQ